MDSRALVFIPPHTNFTALSDSQISNLMWYTHKYPDLMKNAPYFFGGISVAMMLSTYCPRIPRPIKAGFFIAGVTGAFGSITAGLLQNKLFGFPLNNTAVYKPDFFKYESAEAILSIDDIHFPRLTIKSSDCYAAGYVEGNILGDAIHANLNADAVNFLVKLVYIVLGFPSEEKFKAYFADILETIPKDYQDEMRGKVDGYNAWVQRNNKTTTPLKYENYVFLQLIPDYKNYAPFNDCRFIPFLQSIGCTTFALRVGNATFFSRILDWIAYDRAAYFIEIQKHVAGKQAITDIAHPLLSGALTVMNTNLLFQINVAAGLKVKKPKGMPAVFFNRFCAENAKDLKDFDTLLTQTKPLGPYHLTVTGEETKSIHFFQNLNNPNEHVVEELNPDKKTPQLLVVANNGIHLKNDKIVPLNFRDSDERKANLFAFFSQPKIQAQLKSYIDKQEDEKKLSSEDLCAIRAIMLDMAKLPLICNVASVLFVLGQSIEGTFQEAYATVNNSFAPNNSFSEFRKLRGP